MENLFVPGISWRLHMTRIIYRRKYTVLTYSDIYIYMYVYVYVRHRLHILCVFIDAHLNFFTLLSTDCIKFCNIERGLTAWRPDTTQNRNFYPVLNRALDVIFYRVSYEGWNFNSGNYLFTNFTK